MVLTSKCGVFCKLTIMTQFLNRGTILRKNLDEAFDRFWALYKHSLFIFWVEIQERETWKIKGGNFRVECHWREVLLGWETFVNTLSSEISLLEGSKSFF